jgi:ABC-2 type transport system ATP-binding protein
MKRMSEEIICLEHVEKHYGSFQVLKDVNLSINKGDIFGLVGRNGAGKTTMFKTILGLSEYTGKVFINGKTGRESRSNVSFFIGKNFFDYMTAEQNLDYYRTLKGIKDKGEIKRVLDLVGLTENKKKYKDYSLGMTQRLGIANALLGHPEIMILDEPVNGLDPQGIADVRNLTKKLNEEEGMTIIISSHILGELEHTAVRFGILNNGVVAAEITEEDLQKQKQNVNIAVNAKDVARAQQILQSNGISVMSVTDESTSLEDYYFNLVGGPKK